MEERLSKAARRELVSAVRRRYREADGTDKGKILDEFVAVTSLPVVRTGPVSVGGLVDGAVGCSGVS